MKFYVFLVLFMSSHLCFAQIRPAELIKIQQAIGQNEINKFLIGPQQDGLPGIFLTTLLPSQSLDSVPLSQKECEDEKEENNSHYEIILISELNTLNGSSHKAEPVYKMMSDEYLKIVNRFTPDTESNSSLDTLSVLERARYVWDNILPASSKPTEIFSPKLELGQEIFIESVVQAASKSVLNEKDLTEKIAKIISSVYKTDKEKLIILSRLSSRLYRVYNDVRNPGYNNVGNNPLGIEIPSGDLTANQMLKAAAMFDNFNGGVCNDNSEVVAMVGEHLFPDHDVLTFNAGSHFGVLVTDGKNHQIIDGPDLYEQKNKLSLSPLLTPSNIRINKMYNGALRDIAVVDTEMGQLTEAAFKTGKSLLKTDADISSMIMSIKKNKFELNAGAANLSDSSDSEVVIVVAKYETPIRNVKIHSGVGVSAQNYHVDYGTKYQLHFRAGAERNIFRYVNSKSELNFSGGAYLSASKSIGFKHLEDQIDFSVGIDLRHKAEFKHGKNNPEGIQTKVSADTEFSYGAKNWGNVTGAFSYMALNDTKAVLKNTRFHLNQVNLAVDLDKTINNKVSGFVKANYQGSNIGQGLSGLVGVNISAPAGAQLIIFSGYVNNLIKGFKTKNSLLGNPSGAQVGVKYKTKKSREMGVTGRSLSGTPSVNATIKIPINSKK